VRQKPRFFGEVREESRKRWNSIENDKELGGAWWLLFKQIQNPRYVLSELLQNADDCGATEAYAGVEDGCFVFRHNGHDFNEAEFRSLCRFAFSNKRRALTIGFRGIGFKSVFSLGAKAQILTPTLAFSFDRQRFTQAEWVDTDELTKDTVLRVQLESPGKEQAIRDQIGHWIKSAVPLLFFRSIRTLRLFDQEIRVEDLGPGPCPRSQIVKPSESGQAVTVLRSEEVDFPPECLEEVRAERNEDISLPPCEVVIFLGATQQQRLYCVLPTEVTVGLPFSCQGPFIQDPARSGIKDPSSSPTNAWLLRRIGALAAESLLTWLRREDLGLAGRAKAYELLPELLPINTGLLSGIATKLILDGFKSAIAAESLLLCADGTLDSLSNTARIPGPAIEAWGAEESRRLFSPGRRSVLARQVGSGALNRLEAWKLVTPACDDRLFDALADESKPAPQRPAGLHALAAFWAYAKRHLQPDWVWKDWWRKAAIVPLSGRTYLGRAKDALPSRSCPPACSAEDWGFIVERADILDDDWKKLIGQIKDQRAESLREFQEILKRRFTEKDLAGIAEGYERSRLDQTPTLDQIFGQVATKVFEKIPPDRVEAIAFPRIAARLNVSFADSVRIRYLCTDDEWRLRSEGLVVRSAIDVNRLLPEDWLRRHLISDIYEAQLDGPQLQAWRIWAANPQKGGLSTFPLPERVAQKVWKINPDFYRIRGAAVPQARIASRDFLTIDHHWPNHVRNHWRSLENAGNADLWQEISMAVVSSWSGAWDGLTRFEIYQEAYNKTHRLDSKDVPAGWLYDLRTRKCIPDVHGVPRLPPEMFRRTPDTLTLLDVEPFVHDRWDPPGCERALNELGVRTQPTDTSKLLDRLRAWTQVDNPPFGPVRDLYRSIERVLPRLPADRRAETLNAFTVEALVRTESAWARSGFCFRENPGGIPGVSVVHPEVRDVIGLWDALKIQAQPSASDALSWLTSLPAASALSSTDRSAASKVLARYPQDAWNGAARWLNLQGRLALAADLRWGCLDPRAVPGLFTSVRSETADFSMLDRNRWQALTASPPRLLEITVERRVMGHVPGRGDAAVEERWLHALGRLLERVHLGEGSEQPPETDREAARRMAMAHWIPAKSVQTQPYLDGTPAGTPSDAAIVWIADALYVDGDSTRAYKALVRELSRPFSSTTAHETIRDCVGRDENWIRAYAEENLVLSEPALDTTDVKPSTSCQEPPPPASVFPEHDLASAQNLGEPEPRPFSPTPAPRPEYPDKPSHPKAPSKLDRLGVFLATRGFQWDEDSDCFVHPDGSTVAKADGVFPWELTSPDRVNPLWLAPAGLGDPNGIEIPAEVWLAAKRCPAVLLAPEENSLQEHHFSALRSEVDAHTLELYSPIYRIRVS